MNAKAVKAMFTVVSAVTLAAMPLTGRSVTVDVTNFQQRYPWNGLVDIDYKITRTGDESALDPTKYSVEISVVNCDSTPAVTNVAHVFRQGVLPVTEGAHRVTWDANAEGITYSAKKVKVFASIVHYAEKYMVIDVSGGSDATTYPVTYMNGAPEGGFNTDEYKGDKIVLRLIPPGSFVMGSPANEPGHIGKESDGKAFDYTLREIQHAVAITKPFYIGVFEITQKQYKNVMGTLPDIDPKDLGDDRPVSRINHSVIRGAANTKTHQYDWPWNADVAPSTFMGKLRAKCKEVAGGEDLSAKAQIDLPTEAQWEYACRAGTTTPYNNGVPCATEADLETQIKELGWSTEDNTGTHKKVGQYLPNAWGLYDMHGNAWEYCLDWFREDLQNQEGEALDPKGPSSGTQRCVRGGGGNRTCKKCRSACRGSVGLSSTSTYNPFGIRLTVTLQ